MLFLNNRIKKIIAVTLAIFTLFFFISPSFPAEEGETKAELFLRYIMNYTHDALVSINTTMLAWLSPDTSEETATLQENFTKLYSDAKTSMLLQSNQNNDTLKTFFRNGNSYQDLSEDNAANFNYQTLITTQLPGKPEDQAKAEAALNKATANYIQYASGTNIINTNGQNISMLGWQGKNKDIENYRTTYNTITSAQTFNSYILNQLYPNYKNRQQFTQTQQSLLTQSTNSSWFEQIATENIGWVLRQLLVYQSQTYVLLTKMIETQKQLLTAQIMSNTLSILFNQDKVEEFRKKAAERPSDTSGQ